MTTELRALVELRARLLWRRFTARGGIVEGVATVVLLAIAGLLWRLWARRRLEGRLLGLLALLYGAARFLLDFLRASDVPYADARYGGLTPAQFGAVLLVAWGAWRLGRAPVISPEWPSSS